MNIIDLELYKWKWFHDIYMNQKRIIRERQAAASVGDFRTFWKEYGAFVSIMPRGSGKTEMLMRIATLFCEEKTKAEQYIITCPTQHMTSETKRRNQFHSTNIFAVGQALTITNPRDYNLLIDEYQACSKHTINRILVMPWKTVTMTGTLLQLTE